ncbi:alpha/beta hydrolase [Rhodohalobacter sp. 8-1]|uniref:alpha/beta hydrolase n=1 Tax=Rhodohalobacter sp. 8-1 TaxID=3131972 RepID=UPI0030EDC85E
MWKTLLKFIAFLLIGYLFIVGLITLLQNQMIFHPSDDIWDTPERLDVPWSEHRVEAPDGLLLHGWMIGEYESEDKPVVVYSHGNAGNISGRVEIAGVIANQGAAVFLYDYRGYGKSDGSPTEEGIYVDGKAVVDYLRDELEIPLNRMIFYGQSLGGAVAARQAAEFESSGLVLHSAFLSGKEVATDIYPFIPRFLVSADFPVNEDLRQAKTERIMIMHSRNDRIVPYRHGKELRRIATEDPANYVTFVELRGGHNTGFSQSREIYARKWAEFISVVDSRE